MNITALDEVRESTGNTLTTVSGKKNIIQGCYGYNR